MKKIFFRTAVLISIAIPAFAQYRNYESVQQLRDLSYNTNILVQDNAFRLNDRELFEVREALTRVGQIIRREDVRPTPRPEPRPQPYPGPGYERKMSVKGRIEMKEFSFDVTDLLQLNNECRQFVQTQNLPQADDIALSLDYGPLQTLTTTGWWKGANQMCYQVVASAKNAGLKMANGQRVINGSIEGKDFEFLNAYDLAGVSRQCEDYLKAKNINQADDMTVSTNFEEVKSLTTTGWWRGSLEICNELIRAIR